jgi:hypothetical protein
MEELLVGGEWLDDLLKEAGGPSEIRKFIRDKVKTISGKEKAALQEAWTSVHELLEQNRVGEANRKATDSLDNIKEKVGDLGEEGIEKLELPHCPFLINKKEIKKLLNPSEEVELLYSPQDDLEKLLSLEMINATRRLLASWGAEVLGERTQGLIQRLEEELEELRESETSFLGEENWDDLDSDRELELVDRLASLATCFAQDLVDLHLLNAANLEVGMRFELLWETVRQLQDDDVRAAAFEALQILEEALDLAGLRSGELLDRVDLLYERLSDAEGLRRAVNRLVVVSRDGEEDLKESEGRQYISDIASALGDLGLKES